MINSNTIQHAEKVFEKRFGQKPHALAYAPGRAEILGNHTDYNDGFVISCAINMGVIFACAENGTRQTVLLAADLSEEATFDARDPAPNSHQPWANYSAGVNAGILEQLPDAEISGINALITSNIPQGAGLSSSAALEIATAMGMRRLFNFQMDTMTLAKTAQWAENNFAGAQCGLMDQISSMYGKQNHFVFTDFRSLKVETIPLNNNDLCLIMCNTKKQHSLVESEYNERRQSCENAAAFFNKNLNRPVKALRDVSVKDFHNLSGSMNPTEAKRARHVIEENNRVLKGKQLLNENKDIQAFGTLMFESHNSSRKYFENSCDELDFVVDKASTLKGVIGARLSGGGFGGSVIILATKKRAQYISEQISKSFKQIFKSNCETRIILPSNGAQIIDKPEAVTD